jgi:hypothetical protein
MTIINEWGEEIHNLLIQIVLSFFFSKIIQVNFEIGV